MTNFLPHTDATRQAMLQAIGLSSEADLFADIPAALRRQTPSKTLPKAGLSELELQNQLRELAGGNGANGLACFLGGGAYSRFIPMAVNTIAGRSEFYTAYTPYQPELSQGTLQVIYEFQTLMAELTGLDVANASVYDGGVAVAEAALMAVRITRRKKILVARGVHPDSRRILQTYATGLGTITLAEVDLANDLEGLDGRDVACLILQQPDFFGNVQDPAPLQAFCQAHGALLIVSADPVSLGLLEAPGRYGADIVVGDIQPLGNALSFGGPYGGFMATRQAHLRQLPGRLAGRTVDKTGRPCYTLTLQTREQHIRREKATSNICTNQALNVLKATVYLSLVGPCGLRHLANLSVQRAHALAEKLTALDGVELLFPDRPFFSEFALKLPVPAETILDGLLKHGILGGVALKRFYPGFPDSLLVSVTETTTPEQIDRYARFFHRLITLQSASPDAGTHPVAAKSGPVKSELEVR